MALTAISDCTTPLEDMKLLNASDYMKLVSSGIGSYGPVMRQGNSNFGRRSNSPHLPWASGGYTEPRLAGLSDDDVETNPVYGINAWPPGPQPSPYKWSAPNGTTWTRVLLDGKWLYQSSKDARYYISASNLYDIMGVAKQPETGLAISPIPGEEPPFSLERWLKKTNPGYLALGALAFFIMIDGVKK